MSLLALTLCTLVGCDGPKSSLGELPGQTTGNETSEATDATATATADEGGSTTVTGEVVQHDVGAPCQFVEFEGVPQSKLLELGNPDCGSGMCLYADTLEADSMQTCTDDDECSGGQGVICGASGRCELDPAHVAARSMCTETCMEDADCVGVDGSACEGGFACVPITSLGPVCCQRVCVCQDDLDGPSTEELVESCEAGGTPGCCDQEPVPEACGG